MDKNIMWLLKTVIEGYGAEAIKEIDMGGKYANYIEVLDGDRVYRFEISERKVKKAEDEAEGVEY